MFGHRLKATFDEANKRSRTNKDVWGLLLEMQPEKNHLWTHKLPLPLV